MRLEVFAASELDPASSQGFDRWLVERAPLHPQMATLRLYTLRGEILSLGRYHLAPRGDSAARVRLHRRLGGGRVLPLGAGYTALSLTLPHRSALVGAEPLALRPEQALNRCVRGLLGGLRAFGIDAYYPGRDLITVERRVLGVVSLEVDAGGAAVFEAVLATEGDWQGLSDLVAAVDPEGAVAAERLSPERVTTLAAHGVHPDHAALLDAVVGSFARQFGLAPCAGAEWTAPPDATVRAAAWVGSRRRSAALDRHAVEWGQLGVFEVYLSASDGIIGEALLAGDFIADSPSISRLEQSLRGCSLTADAVQAAVDAVYADPRSFLLGVGARRAVVDAIVRAA